jgi:DNA primase small subunit
MRMDTHLFTRQRFAEFYEEKTIDIEPPPSMEQREFGFFGFKGAVVTRHKGFTKVEDLRSFIKKTVPSHAYYSTAYYEMPEARMEEKGWLGADLYFDIDADHIPTKCGKVHDTWACKNCGFAGKGASPRKCPSCGNERFDEKTWPCEVCLETAKLEAMKLVNVLIEDFGFSSEEISVSFSGHRGYHVRVENERISELNSVGRKEMVDYITGVGLDAVFHGLEASASSRSRILSGPNLGDVGWRGRIARGTHEFLSAATEEELKSIGLRKKAIDKILENRDIILQSWNKRGPWSLIRGVGLERWKTIIRRGVENQSVKIDTVVTTDIHRLIRLPNSLHGKTGWLKVLFPIGSIERFDPLKSAVAFKKGEATIYVEEAPEFRLGEERFGPFRKQKVELPMAAALFLLCKGAAKVVD